jgi:hypothetical protein
MNKLILLLAVFFFSLNIKAQDAKVKELQKAVFKAMGGQKNYKKTNIIRWTFFGNRTHTWDKKNDLLRIDYLKENTVILLNLRDSTGRVLKKGREITQADSLKMMLRDGRNAWINDSYWLLMPFKIADPGVNVAYKGLDKTEDGKPADVLELTFNKVGVTPENKYLIYVDQSSKLITQWSHFTKASDPKPRFTMPWKDYQPYGKILLSASRGDRKLENLAVYDKLDPSVFNSFEKPKL